MARAKGYQGIVGRKKGTTWGTAVAAGAGDGIEVTSCMIDGNTTPIEDMQITGVTTQRESSAGNRTVTVSMGTALRYEGNEFDIAMILGTAGSPATVDTTAYQHALMINNTQIDGLFSTAAYELIKDTTIIECPSVKWTTLTLRGRAGERWTLEFSGIGYDFEPASAVNTTTTIDTVTLPSNREYTEFSQAGLELNAQDGADFSSDDLYISGFEMTFERSLEGRVSTEHGDKVSEPLETGFGKLTGSFDFSQLATGTGGNSGFMADQMSLARKKMKLTITSGTLAGSSTQYFQHVLWFPNVQFGEGKPGISGPEGQTWTLPFTAHHVSAIPTGFTAGYTGAVIWEVFSQLSTDPLA